MNGRGMAGRGTGKTGRGAAEAYQGIGYFWSVPTIGLGHVTRPQMVSVRLLGDRGGERGIAVALSVVHHIVPVCSGV